MGDALIRHYLHIDPMGLNTDEWVRCIGQAVWLKEQQAHSFLMALAPLFRAKETETD